VTPQRIAEAISVAEGFGVEGSIPQRAHNPLDLKLGDCGFGVLGEGITVFKDDDAGWAAAVHQVTGMLSGHSHYYKPEMALSEVGMIYSGDPNWAPNVAKALGVPVTTTLAQLVTLPDPV
jgi:hypothetical protein